MSFQKLIKTNLLLFFVIIVLELLFAAGSATSSYIIQFAYNQLVKNILIGFLIIIASSVFLSFVSYIFSSLATYLFSKQTQKYIHSIRHKLISKYFHDKALKVAEMENELNGNLQVLTKNYADKSLSIIQSSFLLVTSIGSLLLMNWMLTLLALILSVITLYIPRFTRQRASNATQKVVNRNSKYLLDIEEWFNGLEELRKYTAFNKLNLVMQEVSKNLETSFVKRKKVISIADFLNGCANSFSQIAITLLAAILFFNHQVTFGVIIAAGNFSSMILNCLLTITTSLTRIQSVQELNKQIVESQKVIPSHKEINTDEIYSISTHDLSISFKNGETIHFPDIRIKKGEKVLLSGDSGTGKSTLFKLILNKMYPTTGQVIFEDKYGKKISPDYAQIGYIPQDGKLFPTSIINNIIMFNNKLKQQVKNSIENNDLSKDIASMPNGFETKIDLDTINFSGGQKQKIILARNEIHNFSIILADEATSAIDSRSSYRILKNLVSSNKTVIVIAHNLTQDMEKLFSRKISL
ncbi:MAG: ATP-binding cassette domain-containing protein [Lactobacillus iners]|nr:ABC transporter ATP-binding protein/permease [Lactobacillus iners]